MPNGYPQTHPVWFSFEEPWVLVNTMRGFRKERNMRRDPRVTVLVVDPGPGVHWIEVRGLVELTQTGALRHLDALANRYVGARRYFGEVVPVELADTEVPVIGRIRPRRVLTDTEADARTARVRRSTGPRVARDTERARCSRPLLSSRSLDRAAPRDAEHAHAGRTPADPTGVVRFR